MISMMATISVAPTEERNKMIKQTVSGIVALGILGVGGYGWYSHSSLKKSYEHQKAVIGVMARQINDQQLSLTAYAEQEKTNEELSKGREAAEAIYHRTLSVSNELRKSIAKLQQSSSNSLEACNQSSLVAGELLGTCGDRYIDVARKAELLKLDAIALDQDSTMLRGIIGGLQGLGVKDGNK